MNTVLRSRPRTSHVVSCLLLGVAWLVPASLGDDECGLAWSDPPCVCDTGRLESKVQPHFDESCISDISVSMTEVGGCCTVGGIPQRCYASPCEFDDVQITITPNGTCTIRLVIDGENETPETISEATTKLLGSFEMNCKERKEVVTVQARFADGGWKDIFDLELRCDQCTVNDDPDRI